MKKVIIVFVCLVIVIVSMFFNWYSSKDDNLKEVASFNNQFLYYIDENKILNGVDLTTLINKAIDNNEKNNIKKKENGAYILNKEDSVEILIQLEPKGDFYLMEAFQLSGMTSFTTLYGGADFKCVEIKYHENGKISELKFEICE